MFEQKNEPPRSRIPGVLVEKQAKRSLGVIKLAFSPSGPQSIRAQLWINLSLSVEIWSQVQGGDIIYSSVLYLACGQLPSVARILVTDSMTYLEWSSFENLMSSHPAILLTYKHSQDLAAMLRNHGGSFLDPNSSSFKFPLPPRGNEEPHADVVAFPGFEKPKSSDEEHFKLWIYLIANILVVKYSQKNLDSDKEYNQSSDSAKLHLSFRLLDIVSLGSFLRYVRRFEQLRNTSYSDDEWRSHISRLITEWEDFNLISTVLLSQKNRASAGILALENIGGIARTAILISILSSFGAVATGLYCISKYQVRAPESQDSNQRPSKLLRFKYDRYVKEHPKSVSLVLGLPMALLVWALISFFVGILAFNIVGTETNGRIANVAYGVVAVGGVIVVATVIAMWTLSRLWASEDGSIYKLLPKIISWISTKKSGTRLSNDSV
ncbi:hypothetical protein B0H19DRAFT_1061704 [Mycena capillaripes]|nr:hypothetical protein B0H19DRAFT_1061704 [Mycena capillaripes]